MTHRRQDLRTARARRELGEAVRDDLLDVTADLDSAIAGLEAISQHASGIAGLTALCKGKMVALEEHRTAIEAAASGYRSDLTKIPDAKNQTPPMTQSFDAEQMGRIRGRRAKELAAADEAGAGDPPDDQEEVA